MNARTFVILRALGRLPICSIVNAIWPSTQFRSFTNLDSRHKQVPSVPVPPGSCALRVSRTVFPNLPRAGLELNHPTPGGFASKRLCFREVHEALAATFLLGSGPRESGPRELNPALSGRA